MSKKMEIIKKGNISLYKFQAGTSEFLVNPFEGARLISWDASNGDGSKRSVIYWNSDVYGGSKIAKVHGGNPILFPFPSTSFVGRTPDLWRTPRGDVRPMKRHGYAWNGKFEVAYSSSDELKLKFIPCADCREAYPYDYDFYVRYKFAEKSLIVELILENKGDLSMPWGAGIHPYFTIPWVKGESKRDYYLSTDAQQSTYNVGDGTRHALDNLDKNTFADGEMVGRILCNLKTGTVKAVRKRGGDVTIIINDNKKPDSSFVVVTYGNPKDGDPNFFAIEPWMAPPNCATKPLQFVDGKSTGIFKVEIKI